MTNYFNRLRRARKEIESVEAEDQVNLSKKNKKQSTEELNAMKDRVNALEFRINAIEVNGDIN